jgi:hypothetical protein
VSDRNILRVKFDLAVAPAAARKALGGFLRYVQYRDKHDDQARVQSNGRVVEGMLKYVAHRDRAVQGGRLLGPSGLAGDAERRELTSFVAQSIRATAPVWGRDGKGRTFDRRRAVYRFVISPETAQGLDLQRLTLAAVAQLETDLAGPVRWIAAEHRNTQHPHVHLVVAGIRELNDGRMNSWLLSGSRLARMKGALALEIERQRGHCRASGSSSSTSAGRPAAVDTKALPPATREPSGRAGRVPGRPATLPVVWPIRTLGARLRHPSASGSQRHPGRPFRLLRGSNIGLHRLAARYRQDLERQAEEERRSRGRERTR